MRRFSLWILQAETSLVQRAELTARLAPGPWSPGGRGGAGW